MAEEKKTIKLVLDTLSTQGYFRLDGSKRTLNFFSKEGAMTQLESLVLAGGYTEEEVTDVRLEVSFSRLRDELAEEEIMQ